MVCLVDMTLIPSCFVPTEMGAVLRGSCNLFFSDRSPVFGDSLLDFLSGLSGRYDDSISKLFRPHRNGGSCDEV